jgi:ribosomal protein L16 Arg81 hydroxylase
MLLKSNEIEKIIGKQFVFVKNFTEIPYKYDFNKLSNILEENNGLEVVGKGSMHHPLDFYGVWALHNVENVDSFHFEFSDFFRKLCKHPDKKFSRLDLFFSLVSAMGMAHRDNENVVILGAYGKTIYRIFNKEENFKDYIMEEGDLIYIPSCLKHKSISLTPRIVISLSI